MKKLVDYSTQGSRTSQFGEMRDQAGDAIEMNKLLWETYMVMDHGTMEERLETLDNLKGHFNKFLRS